MGGPMLGAAATMIGMGLAPAPNSTPTLATKEQFHFYPSGYTEKNWGPEVVAKADLTALADAQKDLRARKRLNPTADKFFLANALVENDPGVYGVVSTLDSDVVAGLKEMGIRAPSEDRVDPGARTMAKVYGLVLDHKTGKYADRILGQGAGEKERLSLWNGMGKVVNQNSGRVVADAQNHARKVMEAEAALARPENQELLNFYKRQLGE